MIDTIRHFWEHAVWADRRLLESLRRQAPPPAEALRELLHVLGTEATWLARLEARARDVPVWPEGTLDDASGLLERVHSAMGRFVEALDEESLARVVEYRNSAGNGFRNTVQEILLHVALHGQYHRGKINLLLRSAGLEPAWSDYIAFVRGAPAATEATSRR